MGFNSAFKGINCLFVHILAYNKHLLVNMHGRNVKESKHFMLSSFFLENPAVYDIIWTDVVEPGMPRMTAWRMRIELVDG